MTDSDIYKLVYEIVTEAMIVTNGEGTIVQANPAAVALFEYEMSELIGLNVDDLLPTGLRKIHAQHRSNYVKKPQRRAMGAGLDLEGQTKSGRKFPVEVSLNHATTNGQFHVVALISDISSRKETEARVLQINKELEEGVAQRTQELDAAVKALEESQHLYTLIAQNFPEGTINVLDSQFNYVFADGTEFEKSGIDRKKVIGLNYISLVPEEFRNHVEAELTKVLTGVPRSFEVSSKGNTYIMTAVPLYDDSEEVDRLLLVEKNISEQKQAEQDMIHALNKERELNEMKSRFVSMASHEFRTPLATILSSVNLVNRYAETNNTQGIGKHVSRIRSSVRNLTSILNDFLSLEKLEQGKTKLRVADFSICQLARAVVEEMGDMTKLGQQIVLNCCPGHQECTDGVVRGLDPQLIRNVMFNLLSNAIKYSGEESEITVTVRIDGQLTLSVKDNGMGIPANEQHHLFERFFRAKNATNIQGTGLGLNIVQKHVDLLGGTINFESKLGVGTTFVISLPIENG